MVNISSNKIYLKACATLVVLCYSVLLLTNYGNPWHSSEMSGRLVAMLTVLGTYASLERLRASKEKHDKVLWAVIGLPLFYYFGNILYQVALSKLGFS